MAKCSVCEKESDDATPVMDGTPEICPQCLKRCLIYFLKLSEKMAKHSSI